MSRGVVAEFDADVGLGTVYGDDGTTYVFHAIEIVDGSRTIEVGQPVAFRRLARFGVFQAGRLDKI